MLKGLVSLKLTVDKVGTSGGTEVREITLSPIVACNSFIPVYITTK